MKTIPRTDYYKLLGLQTLATEHEKALDTIRKAAVLITGEEDKYGHTSDALNGNRGLDETLGLLEITVVDA